MREEGWEGEGGRGKGRERGGKGGKERGNPLRSAEIDKSEGLVETPFSWSLHQTSRPGNRPAHPPTDDAFCIITNKNTHAYRVNLIPFVILWLEIQGHHVTTNGGHFKFRTGPALRGERAVVLVHVAGTARGLAAGALLVGEDLSQRAGQRRLFSDHQNHRHR